MMLIGTVARTHHKAPKAKQVELKTLQLYRCSNNLYYWATFLEQTRFHSIRPFIFKTNTADPHHGFKSNKHCKAENNKNMVDSRQHTTNPHTVSSKNDIMFLNHNLIT